MELVIPPPRPLPPSRLELQLGLAMELADCGVRLIRFREVRGAAVALREALKLLRED